MANFNTSKYRDLEINSRNYHAAWALLQDEWNQLRSEIQDLAVRLTSDPDRTIQFETLGERVGEIKIHRLSGLSDIRKLLTLNLDSDKKDFQSLGVEPQTGKRYLQMENKLENLTAERDQALESYQYHSQVFSRCRDFLTERGLLPSTEISMSVRP